MELPSKTTTRVTYHDGETILSEIPDLEKVRVATLRKELLEAHEAAARWEEERREMEDEARSMRDELAVLKVRLRGVVGGCGRSVCVHGRVGGTVMGTVTIVTLTPRGASGPGGL